MKQERASKPDRNGSSELRSRGADGLFRRRMTWLAAVAILCLTAATASYFVFFRESGDAAGLGIATPAALPVRPLGEPPVDASGVLQLPPDAPMTVEQLNEEILAVGRHLVESLPDEPESHTQMAFACMEVGQDQKSLESWLEALAKDENYATGHLGIGAYYAERGENEKAVASLRRAIELDPQLEQGYRELSEVLLRQGDAQKALEVARECVRRFPGNFENHFWMGQANLQLGDHAEARRCHEEAVRLNPNWTASYYSLAIACTRLKDNENAARYRERFAILKAEDMKADRDRNKAYDDLPARRQAAVKRHVLAGAIELQFGHLQAAEAHWLRAGAIAPDDLPTRKALVSLYEKQERDGAELKTLDELIALDPDKPDHLMQKGRLLFARQSWPEAEEVLRRALEMSPDSVELNLRLAHISLRTGRDKAAGLAHAEKAAKLDPSPRTLQLLAAIRADGGDYTGAESALKQALSIDPYDPELRRAYEQVVGMK
ncbi:MAG: tetratricopeptide repeat protein [Thermoguttaceae bacterium]